MSLAVLRVLLDAVHTVSLYPDTVAKRNVWCAIMALLGDVKMKHHLESLTFLNTNIYTVVLPRSAILYTIRNRQVSLSTMIPSSHPVGDEPLWLSDMYDEAIAHLVNAHPRLESIYCATLIRAHMRTPWAAEILQSRPPRFLVKTDILHMQLQSAADGVHKVINTTDNRTHMVFRILHRIHDLGSYRPLSTLRWDDPDDTLYWHKFPCGIIACFSNPPRAFDKSYVDLPKLPLTTPQVAETLHGHTHISLIACLRYERFDWEILRCSDIPQDIRGYLGMMWMRTFGITDDLLWSVCGFDGEYVERIGGNRNKLLLLDQEGLEDFVRLLTLSQKVRDPLKAAARLQEQWKSQDAIHERWSAWSGESSYCHTLIEQLLLQGHTKVLQSWMCASAGKIIVVPLARGLYRRRHAWTSEHVQLTRTLLHMADPSCHSMVRTLFEHFSSAAEKMAEQLCYAEKPTLQPIRRPCKHGITSCRGAFPPDAVDCTEPSPRRTEPASARECTHAARAQRLAADLLHGWEVTLLGSGCFSAASDVDLAVCVPDAQSLDDAYEQVRVRTGWKAQYTRVGERVAVLAGVFESVSVDVQVWRGHPCRTPAEVKTSEAIELTARFTRQLSPTDVARVRRVHDWAHAACLKGQTRCRLPGVAVTVLAACAGDDTLRQTLVSLRDRVFSRVAPRVVLEDGFEGARAEYERPQVPVDISYLSNSTPSPLCTHTTASTTRHVLDALAFALTLDDDALCAASAYTAWRARTMVVAARVRPHSVDASACGVFPAVVGMEGHPLIDAVFVHDESDDEGDELRTLVVRCTLHDDACVSRYGLRDGDVVTRRDTSWAQVCRGSRTWPLALTPRVAGQSTPRAHAHGLRVLPSVCTLVVVEEDVVVPNAPGLTLDVAACFDSRSWSLS